jgi:hypothetical protein
MFFEVEQSKSSLEGGESHGTKIMGKNALKLENIFNLNLI